MPTPNEIITVTPALAGGDLSRPSRLACPPEESIVSRNSSSSTRRQLSHQESLPPTMPQQQLSPTTSSSSSSSDDETSTTTTTTVVTRDVPSAEPSPTLEPKHHSASHGLPLSPESPFVSSLSHEFSARRVCYFERYPHRDICLIAKIRDADFWPHSCYLHPLVRSYAQEASSLGSRLPTGRLMMFTWNSNMLI